MEQVVVYGNVGLLVVEFMDFQSHLIVLQRYFYLFPDLEFLA